MRPIDVHSSNATSTSLTLSWDILVCDEVTETDFDYFYQLVRGDQEITTSGMVSGKMVIVDDLEPCTRYEVFIVHRSDF